MDAAPGRRSSSSTPPRRSSALTANSPVVVNAIVTFSVTVSQNPGNVPVRAVTFSFGDGAVREVQSLSTTYWYSSPGTYVASAVVHFTNGRTATRAVQVRVN